MRRSAGIQQQRQGMRHQTVGWPSIQARRRLNPVWELRSSLEEIAVTPHRPTTCFDLHLHRPLPRAIARLLDLVSWVRGAFSPQQYRVVPVKVHEPWRDELESAASGGQAVRYRRSGASTPNNSATQQRQPVWKI